MNIEYFSTLADGCYTSEERQKTCCNDEMELISLEDEHQPVTQYKSYNSTDYHYQPSYFQLELNCLINISDESKFDSLPDPPDLSLEPAYITNQSFTFYG